MYAQKNYPQHLGNSGYTIAEVGCLLTAICNLLVKLDGAAPDPPTLNQYFLDHGAFIWDGIDRANDDLAWNSISKYDGNIQVSQVGSGSLPPSNNAIVKFHYTGIHTGQPIDHYCAIDHIQGNEVWIIDSWDGLIKGPAAYQGVYHLPIAWATYTKNVPQTAPTPTPAPTPVVVSTLPSAPIPYPTSTDKYQVSKTILGFSSATDAGNHNNAKGTVPAGNYYVFKTYSGKDYLKNVTKVLGQPGSWINANDNVVDSVSPTSVTTINTVATALEAATTSTVIAAPVPVTAPTDLTADPASPNKWKSTYKAYKDDPANPDKATPRKYIIMWSQTPIFNADTGQTRNITKNKGGAPAQYEEILIAGEVSKDGVSYFRPLRNNAEQFLWWLIPEHDPLGRPYLMPYDKVYNSDTTAAERLALHRPSILDRLAHTAENISSKVTKIKVKL